MKGLPYKWIVAIVMIFGVFMSILDTTIINVATTRLESAFGAGLQDIDWVATGYTLAEGVGTPLTPFFTAFLGTKRFYLIALTLFTLGSVFCGLSWSLSALIFFRIVQGLGGACLLPVAIANIYSVFPPEERGTAMGSLGVPILLAPALGPTIGGYLVTYVNWQSMFYINVPIGVAGFIMAILYLKESDVQHNLYFDFPGFIAVAMGLASLLYAFSSVADNGWGSTKVLSFLVIGVCGIAIFAIVEMVTIEAGKQPLLDIRVFGNVSFIGGSIGTLITTFTLYSGMYLLPVYLQGLRAQTAYEAGLLQLPGSLASMVTSFVGGMLVDRLGTKQVAIPGLILLCASVWGFSTVTLTTPLAVLQIWLILRGLSLGMTMQPISNAALSGLKLKQISQGSTLNSVVRSVTSSLAVAIATTLVTTQTKVHYANLTSQVTQGSPAGNFLQQLANYFTGQGMSAQNALAAAAQEISQQLQAQATLLAMKDVYQISLAVGIMGIFVVMFVIRTPKKKNVQSPSEVKNGEGALSVEEESLEPVFMH